MTVKIITLAQTGSTRYRQLHLNMKH